VSEIPSRGGPYNRISESYYIRARDLLSYDTKKGFFTWAIVSKNSNRSIGERAGNIRGNRDRIGLSLNGIQKHIQAHKLAFFFIYGRVPGIIDHINGNSLDNRIENLRECTHAENLRNRGKTSINTTGYKGVYNRNGRFRSIIGINGKSIKLGTFDTAIEAAKKYDLEAIKLHGEFANTNFRR